MAYSWKLWSSAKDLFPGGVNSPVRAALKPYPFYANKAKDAFIYSVDGDRYIDYVLGYGPLILGHRDDRVLTRISEQLNNGWLYGIPAPVEVELARKILDHMYPDGKIRFVNSGTEATLIAIRLARGFTNRKYIVKFDGCYHGSNDYLLVSSGSAVEHYSVPASHGILGDTAKYTLVAKFNDPYSVTEIMEKHGNEVAAIIVEPVMGNLGVIPGDKGFLQFLRKISVEYGSLLIFDEVITGFRLALSGATGYYGIKPDLVTLGKIIGGGFPVGAVLGRKDIMDLLTPLGKVFNAGTFNAHPVIMTAGLATLEILEKGELMAASQAAEILSSTLTDLLDDIKITYTINRVESMFQVFFNVEQVKNADDARRSDTALFEKFQRGLLERGVFIAPSKSESIFTSTKHRSEILEETIEALKETVPRLGG
ncbi:MAG: glutamate-1-semialdehyde 2,1-aminomutase [Desulfurococcales archaeon]|nr:glutamate-1-semialdehyde 2,1-aminomutase [Desulfurococcales archaeon]